MEGFSPPEDKDKLFEEVKDFYSTFATYSQANEEENSLVNQELESIDAYIDSNYSTVPKNIKNVVGNEEDYVNKILKDNGLLESKPKRTNNKHKLHTNFISSIAKSLSSSGKVLRNARSAGLNTLKYFFLDALGFKPLAQKFIDSLTTDANYDMQVHLYSEFSSEIIKTLIIFGFIQAPSDSSLGELLCHTLLCLYHRQSSKSIDAFFSHLPSLSAFIVLKKSNLADDMVKCLSSPIFDIVRFLIQENSDCKSKAEFYVINSKRKKNEVKEEDKEKVITNFYKVLGLNQ